MGVRGRVGGRAGARAVRSSSYPPPMTVATGTPAAAHASSTARSVSK